jgi:hypothetical protein
LKTSPLEFSLRKITPIIKDQPQELVPLLGYIGDWVVDLGELELDGHFKGELFSKLSKQIFQHG